MPIRSHARMSVESIILPIDAPRIRPDVLQKLRHDGYSLKREFHVTVVPTEIGKQLTDAQYIMTQFLVNSLVNPRPYFSRTVYEVSCPKVVADQTHSRQSLVVPVTLPHLDVIHGVVASKLDGQMLDEPFWHVTLATRPATPVASRGIGIASQPEWDQLQPIRYVSGWQDTGEEMT